MKVKFKISACLAAKIRQDLLRPHPYAAERVGFIGCWARTETEVIVVIAHEYYAVEDGDYIEDPTVGAMMGSEAIRKALQQAHFSQVAMFHVHMHEHEGRPAFSRIDARETRIFVPDFFSVQPEVPHGAIVLSRDSACGMCWPAQGCNPIAIDELVFVGWPTYKVQFS